VRQWMNENPRVTVSVVGGLLLVVLGYALLRGGSKSADVFDPDNLRENVTIVYSDTGDREEMPLGRLVGIMTGQTGPNKPLPPNFALLNSKTKKSTGKLEDEARWKSIIEQVNQEVARMTSGENKAAK
jgi:hypothetical protein